MAHALQQVANDAARAAVAGLTVNERSTLANSVLASEIPDYAYLHIESASTSIDSTDTAFTIRVSYDASSAPFWTLSRLVPMPSSTIVRSATVRLGGY